MLLIYSGKLKKKINLFSFKRNMWSSSFGKFTRYAVPAGGGIYYGHQFYETYEKHKTKRREIDKAEAVESLDMQLKHKLLMKKEKNNVVLESEKMKLEHIKVISKSKEKYEGSVGFKKVFSGNALTECEKSDLEIVKFFHETGVEMKSDQINSTSSYCVLESMSGFFLDSLFFLYLFSLFSSFLFFIYIYKDHLLNGFLIFFYDIKYI
jgi:hypothetical protein